jgi:hypothetical protein
MFVTMELLYGTQRGKGKENDRDFIT